MFKSNQNKGEMVVERLKLIGDDHKVIVFEWNFTLYNYYELYFLQK